MTFLAWFGVACGAIALGVAVWLAWVLFTWNKNGGGGM